MLYESSKHGAKAVTPSANSMVCCVDICIIIIIIIIIIITVISIVPFPLLSNGALKQTKLEALTVPCFVVKQLGNG